MAKTQSLDSSDLKVSAPQNRSATRQRGITPSAELVPLQFKMPRSSSAHLSRRR